MYRSYSWRASEGDQTMQWLTRLLNRWRQVLLARHASTTLNRKRLEPAIGVRILEERRVLSAPQAIAVTPSEIAENTDTSSNVLIGTLTVTQDDDGLDDPFAPYSYSLVGNQQDNELFEIQGDQLFLKSGLNLDYESDNLYRVRVQVNDNGATSNHTLDIDVLDVNEPVGPITDTDNDANAVDENDAPGTRAEITAAADDPDSGATVTYSLTDDADGRFVIDPDTGVVRTAVELDAETALEHVIVVEALSSDGSTSSATFTIAVNDLNEAPIGSVTDADADANQVDEGVAGALVGVTASATDPDATATVSYSLTDDAGGRFRVDSTTGVVRTAVALDAESATEHVIVVEAQSSDGSDSQATFTISVNDVNEAPVGAIIDDDSNVNQVDEGVVGGLVGVTAAAIDPDLSDTVTYSLTDDAGGRFVIDPDTGVVRTLIALDAETATEHVIVVQALSSDTSTSEETFTISVNDVNEAPIGAVTDEDTDANQVNEGAAGAVVGVTALATDPDVSATVSYSLTDDAGGRFTIDSATGVVRTAIALDAETAVQHVIIVEALSSDTTTSSGTFTINVNDVNEAPIGPVTDADTDANAVDEGLAGTLVGITATAVDPDVTATVSYSLTDDAGGRFVIDPTTGVVRTAIALDAEAAMQHVIVIEALSSDTSTSDETFTISVNDVNEAPVGPVTDADANANQVDEGVAGAEVGITATADDPDTNDTVTYSLTDDAGGQFTIDPDTGVVSTLIALDAETATEQTIVVQALSSDGTRSSETFTISVNDVNEAPIGPVSDINGAANQVDEGIAGALVGITARAVDPDVSATVSYSLTNDDGGRFQIDSTTGVVRTAVALDAETATEHVIVVEALSSDTTTSTETFTISVNDINEAPVGPVTDADTDANQVNEGVAGALVGVTAVAVDPDITATVSYSLTDDAGGRFIIDPTSGVVRTATALNFEEFTQHIITVQALSTDGSTSTEAFTISVNDVNEPVGPVIDSDVAANQVDEGVAGAVVGITATAVDPDIADTVSYSLTDDAGGRFVIDPNTGVVRTAVALDAESSLQRSHRGGVSQHGWLNQQRHVHDQRE